MVWKMSGGKAHIVHRIGDVFPGVTGDVRLATPLPGKSYMLVSGDTYLQFKHGDGENFVNSNTPQLPDFIVNMAKDAVGIHMYSLKNKFVIAIYPNGTRVCAFWNLHEYAWYYYNDYFTENIDYSIFY
jgi:hypothetical protein